MSSPELLPSQREHLRARIAEILAQEPRKRRYGNDLKRAIVDYAFARQDERVTIGQIAAELDLSASLLGKWLRHARLRREKGSSTSRRAWGEVDAMGRHLDVLEHLLGREGASRGQG